MIKVFQQTLSNSFFHLLILQEAYKTFNEVQNFNTHYYQKLRVRSILLTKYKRRENIILFHIGRFIEIYIQFLLYVVYKYGIICYS